MTRYLDEYDAGSNTPNRRVQSDPNKLKFNNIQSCIAVILVPAGATELVGMHLTTWTTGDRDRLKAAMLELSGILNGRQCDAYLVATFGHHERTGLMKHLKQLANTVYLCNIAPTSANAADADVKVELNGGRVAAYVRKHAVNLKGSGGGVIVKPAYDRRTAPAGKPMYRTDRDDKPWMAVAFREYV